MKPLLTLIVLATFGCVVPTNPQAAAPGTPNPKEIIIRSRVWKDVTADEMFRTVVRWNAEEGTALLNQSKEDGIILTDWINWTSGKNRDRFRRRTSFVITTSEGGTQLRVMHKNQYGGSQSVYSDIPDTAFPEAYSKTFDEVSRRLGKPFEGQAR